MGDINGPEQVIVDVGCGTGALTRVMAGGPDYKKDGTVIGIDRNEPLRVAVLLSTQHYSALLREELLGAG